MDYSLTEEHQMVREAAREFADQFVAPRAEACDRDEIFPIEQFRAAGELGFTGVLVPEVYGGSELGDLALALVLEEINRVCASTGVTLSVHNSLCCAILAGHANEEQKQRWLPRLASGEHLGAYSLSEAPSGSDAAALTCRATRDGDHYVLEGTKLWVTSGSHADVFVVFVRTDPDAPRSKGISCLVIDRDTPGFTISKKEDKLGLRGSSTNELVFEGCRVPVEQRLGEENDGFAVAMSGLDGGRIGIAAQSLGIAQACLDASVKYAKEREQFGKPIAKFQPIQWKIAEMATRLEAARLLTWRAAWLKDSGQPHTTEASMAKLQASRAANYCAKEAVQIHGGAGYTVDFPVERFFRDARITEIYEGTTEIQKLVISRAVLRG